MVRNTSVLFLFLLVGCSGQANMVMMYTNESGMIDEIAVINSCFSQGLGFNKENNSCSLKDWLMGCSWNLQIFGIKKADDAYAMNVFNKTLRMIGCDFIVVQEIRDESGVAFEKFCDLFPEFKCFTSSRAGRSASKEQYGVLHNEYLSLNNIKDFNPDPADRWERPPFLINFSGRSYDFSVVVIHTKPDRVKTFEELEALEEEFENITDKVMIIGDANAACDYLSYEDETFLFSDWVWMIPHEADTTSTNSNCSYDRIIVEEKLRNETQAVGVWVWNIPVNVSDHYPVWIKIKR